MSPIALALSFDFRCPPRFLAVFFSVFLSVLSIFSDCALSFSGLGVQLYPGPKRAAVRCGGSGESEICRLADRILSLRTSLQLGRSCCRALVSRAGPTKLSARGKGGRPKNPKKCKPRHLPSFLFLSFEPTLAATGKEEKRKAHPTCPENAVSSTGRFSLFFRASRFRHGRSARAAGGVGKGKKVTVQWCGRSFSGDPLLRSMR